MTWFGLSNRVWIQVFLCHAGTCGRELQQLGWHPAHFGPGGSAREGKALRNMRTGIKICRSADYYPSEGLKLK